VNFPTGNQKDLYSKTVKESQYIPLPIVTHITRSWLRNTLGISNIVGDINRRSKNECSIEPVNCTEEHVNYKLHRKETSLEIILDFLFFAAQV
jgi:hypothetical protein